jgi:ribose transport system permease protein
MSIKNLLLNYGVYLAFLIVCVAFSLLSPAFLTTANLLDLLRQISIVTVVAFGMTLVIISGGIDLSTGAVVGIAGLALTTVLEKGGGLLVGCLVALLFGVLFGVINGTLVTRANMNPFIVTIATLLIGNSLQIVYTRGGLPIYLMIPPKNFMFIAHGRVGGIPVPVIILLMIFGLYYLLLQRSSYGRYLYAIGSNIDASELSGIKYRKIVTFAYILSGISAALAGIVLSSRVMSGQPLAGEAYLLDAIGASFMGTIISKVGRPSLLGTMFGSLFIGVMMNGLTLLNVVFYWQEFAKGFLILFILLIWALQKAQREVVTGK